MPLINSEVTLQLTCSKKSIAVAGNAANHLPKFKINEEKLCVTVATLSIQDNIKLSKQLVSGFKRKKNCICKKRQAQNQYLDF